MGFLLVQVRAGGDRMIPHEQGCFRRRLEGENLLIQNAVTGTLDSSVLQDVEGVVFGGSGEFGVHDPASREWIPSLRSFLDTVLSNGIPGFGICFGHQLLGLHLGGEVVTSPPHAEIGTTAFELTPEGRMDPVFGQLSQRFSGQTGHSDSVLVPPQSVTVLAQNGVHSNQAFRVNGAPFYSTQFHPDLLGAEAIERYRAYEATMASRTERADDGALLFRPGEDDAAALLGHFRTWVRTREETS